MVEIGWGQDRKDLLARRAGPLRMLDVCRQIPAPEVDSLSTATSAEYHFPRSVVDVLCSAVRAKAFLCIAVPISFQEVIECCGLINLPSSVLQRIQRKSNVGQLLTEVFMYMCIMGYSTTCLIFSPCCHSICLALKVICLEHHPSLLFVA